MESLTRAAQAQPAAPGPAADGASDPDTARANPARQFFEQERRVVFLPLENDTRDDTLDFLSTGIPKILGGKVESVGYARVSEPARLFVVTPLADSAATLSTPDDARADRYSRERDGRPASLEVRRVALKVSVRELDDDTYEAVRMARPADRAARLKADYLVGGSYAYADAERGLTRENGMTRRGPITVSLRLYDARTGRGEQLNFSSAPEAIYRQLDEPAARVRNFLAGGVFAPVVIETPEPGAMVYLDDLYLGRTPIEAQAVPGRYEMRVEQDGFETVRQAVVLGEAAANAFRVRAARVDHRAKLSVISEPPGATVFLDHERLGETPLERADLAPGAHRVRVALAGHVDRHFGVELKNEGEAVRLEAALQPGDSDTFYLDPGHVVLDWNYYDLAFYTGVGTLGFYGGYVYFDVRADRIRDRVRAQVPALALWELESAFTSNGLVVSYYQYQLVARSEAQAQTQNRLSRISGGLGIASLLVAGFFAYRGISLDEDKEVGELSWFLRNEWWSADGACATEVRRARDQGELLHQAGVTFAF